MKKSRILTLVLSIVLVAVMAITLFACNDKCTEHVDENKDFVCDNCSETLPGNDNEDYTFTLKDRDQNPIENAAVKVIVEGADGEVKLTDENGMVVFSVKKGAKHVAVEVIEVPAEYDLSATYHPFTNSKTLVSAVAVKKDVYTITVVDQNGDAVEGVQVQLCFGEVCMDTKPLTNGQGKAVFTLAGYSVENAYVSINSLPTGYELKEGEILNQIGVTDYTHYDDFSSNGEIVIEIVKQTMATVFAGGLFQGQYFGDIEIKVYETETDKLIATVVTDANGKASFPVEKDFSYVVGKETIYNYYLVAKHVNNDPRYTWDKPEDGIRYLTNDNLVVDFVFIPNVNYTVNVTRTNTELSLEGIKVTFMNRLFEEVASVDTDANGVATFNMIPYDVYYVKTGDAKTGTYKIEKDGTTTHNIVVNDNVVLGSEDNPIDLIYGDNAIPQLTANESIYCRVINPQGATITVDPALAVLDEDGFLLEKLGNEDKIIKIQIKDGQTVNSWCATIAKEGTADRAEIIKEHEAGEISVNLVNGKYYYVFEATSTATLTLSSNDNLTFEIDGEENDKAVLAGGDAVKFAVLGEGNANFNVNYAVVKYDYQVSVNLELIGEKVNETEGEIEIGLYVGENKIASGKTENGKILFKDIPEYPIGMITAEIDSVIPENYIKFYGNLNGATFTLESYDTDKVEGPDKWQYEANYQLVFKRTGTKETPYKWANEGHTKVSAYLVELARNEEGDYVAFVESLWDTSTDTSGTNVKSYKVFVKGDYTLTWNPYNSDMKDYNYESTSKGTSTYDAENDVTVLEVPVNRQICIVVEGTVSETIKLRWASSVSIPEGDHIERGTSIDPFILFFGEMINTPSFTQSVNTYYYTYTATVDMSVKLYNANANINVLVNEEEVDVVNGEFTVVTGDKIVLEVSASNETDEKVSFAVQGK